MTKLRLMSHNQWNRDNNSPEWAAQGLDCSAEHRMRGSVRRFDRYQPEYYLPLSDHAPVFIDMEM